MNQLPRGEEKFAEALRGGYVELTFLYAAWYCLF